MKSDGNLDWEKSRGWECCGSDDRKAAKYISTGKGKLDADTKPRLNTISLEWALEPARLNGFSNLIGAKI